MSAETFDKFIQEFSSTSFIQRHKFCLSTLHVWLLKSSRPQTSGSLRCGKKPPTDPASQMKGMSSTLMKITCNIYVLLDVPKGQYFWEDWELESRERSWRRACVQWVGGHWGSDCTEWVVGGDVRKERSDEVLMRELLQGKNVLVGCCSCSSRAGLLSKHWLEWCSAAQNLPVKNVDDRQSCPLSKKNRLCSPIVELSFHSPAAPPACSHSSTAGRGGQQGDVLNQPSST